MDERYTIASVQKALKILRLLIENEREFTFTEIAKASGGMNRSNVLRILATLKSEGFVAYNEESHLYHRGKVFMSIGAEREEERLKAVLEDDLQKAAIETGMIVHFTILSEGKLRILLRCFPFASFESLALASLDDGEVPANATGAGKIFAAYLDKEEREKLLSSCPFESYSPSTITDRRVFDGIVAKVRERGYATNNCEHEEFLCCLARPVFQQDGSLVGALSFSGLKDMFQGERYEKMNVSSISLAKELSRRFGYAK